MGFGSIWHWVIVLIVVLLLFGSGKISGIMGDVAKGIKSFKKGMKEDEPETAEAPKEIKSEAAQQTSTEATKDKAANG